MLQAGDVVERYRVELTLGEGGAATVYRVRHTTLGTLHALKVLHVHHPTMRARLVDEGRIQARLRHPNIVQVSDVLEVQGAPALLMEFVGGGSLADRVRPGGLPLPEAEVLFRGVVAGVAHAHAHDLAHRDLKPANVLLAPRDPEAPGHGPDPWIPKVTDFGIARVLGGEGPGRTRTGVGMGTPAYMAPEQGGDAAGVDARADLFSLGVMLYELVTGHRPFTGPTPVDILIAARNGRYRDPRAVRREVPAHIAAAIQGCLVVDRDRRVQDCDALLALLDGQEATETVTPLSAAGPGEAGTETVSEFSPFTLAPPTRSPPTFESLEPTEDALPPAAASPAPAPAPAAVLPAPVAQTQAPTEGAVGVLRTRTVTALVVDETGRGHALEVMVALRPGDGGVWAPDDVERDAQVAAQLAIAVALGPEARRWSVRWGVKGGGARLHGTSIGLAIAVATRAARMDVPVPDGWAFTGGVELDEQVTPVSGVPAKVRAAAAAGCARVAVPASDRTQLRAPAGIEVLAVSDFGTLADTLLPAARPAPTPPWRRWWRLAVLLLPLLAAITEVLAPLDAGLQRAALHAMRDPVPVDDVAVLGIDVPDVKSLRARHPDTLRAICKSGAAGVILDFALSSASAHDDAIAAAIREVGGAGCPVALPVRFHWGEAILPASDAIADAATLVLVESKRDLVWDLVQAAPARRVSTDGTAYWHAATIAAAMRLRPESPPTPELRGNTLVIGALRNPTWAGLVFPSPTALPPVVPYGATDRYDQLADKVVLVGVTGGDQDIHRTPDGRRYGVELLAGVTQTLLRQAALRAVPPEASAIAALIAGLGAAWLASLLPAGRRLAGLVVPIGVLAVGLALAASGVLVAFLPIALATVIGLWAEAGARRAAPAVTSLPLPP